jgi:transcriptional regulator with XRE-family HTH domain
MVETRAQPLHLGETLKTLRGAAGLSVRTLASRAGFSASFISQVENDQASPSIASLERIASALGVSLVEFFGGGVSGGLAVVRPGDRRNLTSVWSRARIEALSGASSGVDAVMITISPGGRSSAEPHSHKGDEFAIVFDGEIILTLGEDTTTLRRGDAVSFSSLTPHRWQNDGSEPAQLLIASTRFTH